MKTLYAPIALVALAWAPDASACGGFFCQTVPIDQAAERVVLAVDEEAQQVEMHVQITYEGAAEEFAWVLPVPEIPELFLSVDDLFTRLSPLTMPLWNLGFDVEGECGGNGILRGTSVAMSDSADSPPSAMPSEPGDGVQIASQGTVGPYEQVTLRADDSAVLLEWLGDNGYLLPDELGPKLDPYVAGGSWFVALKLANDKDSGDLSPLGLTYGGTLATIPLQLTAIAATPDMPLQPFVFGSSRAVPSNYLHVEVNELAVDWLTQGANYPDVITQAANEAGGHAFATDFSGSTVDMRGTLWSPTMYDTDVLRGQTQAVTVLDQMQFQANIPVSNGTVPILAQFLPVPQSVINQGATEIAYYQCIECWIGNAAQSLTIDGNALADALMVWVDAMERAEGLFANHDTLTRMTSSISAEEMTVDPAFVLNPDMDPVDNQHQATLVTVCSAGVNFDEAPRKLVLEDGRELWLPAEYANGDPSFDYGTYLGAVAANAAEIIEETSSAGAPTMVTDNRAAIDAALASHNAGFTTGCGCTTGGSGGALALLFLPVVLLRRRSAGVRG